MTLDLAEAVADVGIDAEDAPDVHVALEGGRHRAQLDLAVLGDGGDAGGEAAGQTDQDQLDRRGAVVLRREQLGVVPVEEELGAVALLRTEAEEALDVAAAVGAVVPRCWSPAT